MRQLIISIPKTFQASSDNRIHVKSYEKLESVSSK